ncbi:MAG: hypothetical protein Q9170_005099 [Blastenia crenularia]
MAANRTPVHSSHPWNDVAGRPFWNAREPRSWWKIRFRQQSSGHTVPNPRGVKGLQVVAPQSTIQPTISAHQSLIATTNESDYHPCSELPGHVEGNKEPMSWVVFQTPDFHNIGSPTELMTMENGTYSDIQRDFSATARRAALETRRKQTLEMLEAMQIDEPGIIRLRHPRPPAELDSDTSRLAELAGSGVEDDGISLLAQARDSTPLASSIASSTDVTPTQGLRDVSGANDMKISEKNNPDTNDEPRTEDECRNRLIRSADATMSEQETASKCSQH